MKIISLRERPEYLTIAIRYLQSKWPAVSPKVYEDCLSHCLDSENPLPQWYLLEKEQAIIGCAGLVTNDFISRMDLYPWLCALYIEEKHRGNSYGRMLIEKGMEDCRKYGFRNMYLSTDHTGLYERYGFSHLGYGYGPSGDESRIYEIETQAR